jgi:hypothetical protein
LDSREILPSGKPKNMNMSEYIFSEVPVLCLIRLNNLNNLDHKYTYLHESWERRCRNTLFVIITNSPVTNPKPTFGKGTPDILQLPNMSEAFKHIQNIDADGKFHWILSVNEDTYVVMENLCYMLYPYEANDHLLIANEETIVSFFN